MPSWSLEAEHTASHASVPTSSRSKSAGYKLCMKLEGPPPLRNLSAVQAKAGKGPVPIPALPAGQVNAVHPLSSTMGWCFRLSLPGR